MEYQIVQFTKEHLEPAVNIFINNYKNEQEKNPLLPMRAIEEPEWILDTLKSRIENPGVAVLRNDCVVAYMVTGPQFLSKGQDTVLVPAFCHGSVPGDKRKLYQRMYMYLAERWAKSHQHLHIISHFAHDVVLRETLFQLGFGAIIAERVRDLSTVSKKNDVEIVKEKDYQKLVDICIEDNLYYRDSPIFISKNTGSEYIHSNLKTHANDGDIFLVYYDQYKPCAFFIVGTSAKGPEGFLLRETRTAQIKGAYIQSHARGKGIGKAILQRAINWSKERGCERLFVEHETANYYGANFWSKYFSPYLYFSMRYIDNTIDY